MKVTYGRLFAFWFVTAVIVISSASLKSKSVGARTITSPTYQLNLSPAVLSMFNSIVVAPTLAVVYKSVHDGVFASPCI